MRQEDRYLWLDFVRGVAAVAVCGSHLRNAMIVDYGAIGSSSLLQKVYYLMTGGVAHQAVMVFFVLSGCFVGGGVLRNRHAFDPVRYATARLTRLWVVLIPALVFTALIDSVTRVLAPDVLAGVYKPTWHSGPSDQVPCSSTLATFVANIFFLQTVEAPVFGTNGPLWTLANEFWYYVLFPLFFMAFYGRVRGAGMSLAARVLSGLAAVGLLLWLPVPIAEGFLVWLMGVVVAAVRGRLSPRANTGVLVAGAVSFIAALAYCKSVALQHQIGVPADLLVGASCCLLVVGILNRPPRGAGTSLFARMSVCFSEFSYSLYLVHFPLVALIGGLVYSGGKLPPTLPHVATFGLWLVALIGIGYVFYLCFERHTEAVRRWVDQTLGLSVRPARG